jgi:hypothetical protein
MACDAKGYESTGQSDTHPFACRSARHSAQMRTGKNEHQEQGVGNNQDCNNGPQWNEPKRGNEQKQQKKGWRTKSRKAAATELVSSPVAQAGPDGNEDYHPHPRDGTEQAINRKVHQGFWHGRGCYINVGRFTFLNCASRMG